MEGDGLDVVPASYQEGAEEIRAHLVSLRGGAPFLSPADALLLVRWFDKGVRPLDILQALERAWQARRKKPSKVPFTLGHARRHLGKPLQKPRRQAALRPAEGPLGALVAPIRERAVDDPHQGLLLELAEALGELPAGDPDELARQALGLIRVFRERVWEHTPDAEKAALRERARAELGELLEDLDEAVVFALLEEEAREAARARYGWLDAAAVWAAVEDA